MRQERDKQGNWQGCRRRWRKIQPPPIIPLGQLWITGFRRQEEELLPAPLIAYNFPGSGRRFLQFSFLPQIFCPYLNRLNRPQSLFNRYEYGSTATAARLSLQCCSPSCGNVAASMVSVQSLIHLQKWHAAVPQTKPHWNDWYYYKRISALGMSPITANGIWTITRVTLWPHVIMSEKGKYMRW